MVRKVKRSLAIHPDWKESGFFEKFMQIFIYGLFGSIVFFAVLKGFFSLTWGLSWTISVFLTLLVIAAIFVYARRRRRRIMHSPNPAIKKVVYYLVISVSIIIIGVLIGVTVFYEPDPEKVKGGVMGFRLMMAHGVLIVTVLLALYIFISRKEAKEEKEKTEAEKINNGQLYEIYKDVLKGKFVDISQLRAYLPSDENGVLDRLLDELIEHQNALQGKQGNIDKNDLEYLLVFAGALLFSTPAGIDDIGEFYEEIKTNEELHSEEAIIKFLKEYIEVFHLRFEIFFSSIHLRLLQNRMSEAAQKNIVTNLRKILIWSSIFIGYHSAIFFVSDMSGKTEFPLYIMVQGPGNFLVDVFTGPSLMAGVFNLIIFIFLVFLVSTIAGIKISKGCGTYFYKGVAYFIIWVVSGTIACF